MKRFGLAAFVLSILSALPPAEATTVAPPSDLGRLARMSEAVTFARAVESWAEEGETFPVTVTRFHRLETVAGAKTGEVFEVREPGGRLEDRAAAVAGAPRYEAGRNYLLFLDRAPGGRWRSKMMAYGLLEEVEGTGLLRPLAEAEAIELLSPQKVEPVGVYRKAALLEHLREVALGAPWNRQAVAAAEPRLRSQSAELHAAPAFCVFLSSGGVPIRWFNFETGVTTVTVLATTPGQTGIGDGGTSAVQQGQGAWTNHADSVIRYNYGGTVPANVACSGGTDTHQGAAIFNDPCSDIANLSSCTGTLAIGGAFFNPNLTQLHDGEGWHPIVTTFVVVNNGTQCVGETGFREMMTHELGHTMGFGHHTPANPADATMSAFLKNDGRGASIAIADQKCASYGYHTFLDVPFNFWAWRWIEAIESFGVTTGCGSGNYCPGGAMTRGDMATFLLKAKEGAAYVPPACTVPLFADVPCSNPLAPWINELVLRGVTAGCGGGNYCPASAVTRSQMAVFLLSTLEGPGYVPPACPPSPFGDVSTGSPFCPWIKEIANRGITAGCGGGNYCPNSIVNRDQMAIFLATNFNLPLPPAP